MLELKDIKKTYLSGENSVEALKGIDLSFREDDFVAILGPSGCGKTTLLNIIGGLDQYSSGDLVINGRSTKDYKDRDWDTYRNHSIGFVFQSYNLIPHQTVYQNVELALTVSGIKKSERKKRVITALEQVGLGNQLEKLPNQISGGQMQRVAIARALVNDPDIILADEPTGALDTETSVQVMEVLKEISKTRLVIMVTHNAELAKSYATRIIRMLDGKIIDDSFPLSTREYEDEKRSQSLKEKKSDKKPNMSFITAFMLSLKNLISKKGRTMLVSFAGSIGIMGIALITAVSQGTTLFIDSVQEDALSSYPLTIEKNTVDISSLMKSFMNIDSTEVNHKQDKVYKKAAIYNMLNAMSNVESSENDLTSFKRFLSDSISGKNDLTDFSDAITGVQYSYDLGLIAYTKNVDGSIIPSDTEVLLRDIMSEYLGTDTSAMQSMLGESENAGASFMESIQSTMGASRDLWQEMMTEKDGREISSVLKNQYDLLYGDWPSNFDEVVLVVDKNNELDDMTLYALGLEPKESVEKIMKAAMDGTDIEKNDQSWSYEDISNTEFRVILNSEAFVYDESTGLYNDLRDSDAGLQYLYDNALPLKISGIIKPNDTTESSILKGSIAYTKDLTDYIIKKSEESKALIKQLENKDKDIISGLPFKTNVGDLSEREKEEAFINHLNTLNQSEKAMTYIKIMSIPSNEELDSMSKDTMKDLSREDLENMMKQALSENMNMDENTVTKYLNGLSDEELNERFEESIKEKIKIDYATKVQEEMSTMSEAQLASALDNAKDSYTREENAYYYDEIMEFSDSTYDNNLALMGYLDIDSPSAINIYASSFENKDVIEDAIKDYNKGLPELSQIKYTDFIGIMMDSVTTIINAITYVLLAFVAISLIVSSIMIGVITLISVQERTKEIGILRAIGASKKDVSSMFNAETAIIGFFSGLIGVFVTYLLCIPINMVLHNVTGIENLNAFLPVNIAVILVLISMVLSLIAGLIPARSAAKKDPVVALRSE